MKAEAPERVNHPGQEHDSTTNSPNRCRYTERCRRRDTVKNDANDRWQVISQEHDDRAAQDEKRDRKIVENIIDDERRDAVDERNPLAKERHLRRFAEDGPREGQKADGFAAESD